MDVQQQIDEFRKFAIQHAGNGGEHSIDVLYSEWRRQSLKDVDALAVKASVRDLENGERGQPLDEFLSEFDEGRK